MAQYGSGPQRGPMGQTLMGGLNNVGQRGISGNAGLSQAALQRQAGNGVNMGALGGASGNMLCFVQMSSERLCNLAIATQMHDLPYSDRIMLQILLI